MLPRRVQLPRGDLIVADPVRFSTKQRFYAWTRKIGVSNITVFHTSIGYIGRMVTQQHDRCLDTSTQTHDDIEVATLRSAAH